MARGRMINNAIARDKRVHDLPDDTCRLLFTWLITFADCEGRTHGDAAIVRSTVFPRREDVTIEQTEGYLQALASAGLIVLYEVEGDRYLYFPAFDKNQSGLRKDREPQSDIPAPLDCASNDDTDDDTDDDINDNLDDGNATGEGAAEVIRQSSGNHPANIRKLSGKHPEVIRQTSGRHPAIIRLKRNRS